MLAQHLPDLAGPWAVLAGLALLALAYPAIAGTVLALRAIGNYIPADQGEPSEPAADFVDTAAAIDSWPASLSERDRVDQVLNMPPAWVRWRPGSYMAGAGDSTLPPAPGEVALRMPAQRWRALPLDAVVVELPEPDAEGNACSCARSDRIPLEVALQPHQVAIERELERARRRGFLTLQH